MRGLRRESAEQWLQLSSVEEGVHDRRIKSAETIGLPLVGFRLGDMVLYPSILVHILVSLLYN